MLVLLFLCYGLALAAAYRVASRLAPTSWLHTGALTVLLWIINLIAPLTYLGLVNLLRPEAMLIGGSIFWGAQWWLAGRLRPLPALAFADSAIAPAQRRYLRYARIFFAACFVTIVLVVITNAIRSGPVEDTDAAWHYIPAMLNIWQEQSLFTYDYLIPYLPIAFELMFAWEMTFSQSLHLIPAFHLAIWIASLMYTALTVQFLLRRHSRLTRGIATYSVLIVLIVSRLSLTLVVSTGKNDILLLLCTLAAVYYLLRYWQQPEARGTLLLVGIVCGLLQSTKITAVLWLGILALFHLVFLFLSHRLIVAVVLRDLITVFVPFVLLFLPWGVRLLPNPVPFALFAPFNAIGGELTIPRQWNTPEFISATLERVPELLLMVTGVAIILLFRNKSGSKMLIGGSALVLLGLVIQVTNSSFSISFAPFIAVMSVCLLLLIGLYRQMNVTVILLLLMVLVSMTLLAFVPYSATIFRFPEPSNYTFQTINYRYSPGTWFLFMTVLAVIIAELTGRKQPDVAQIKPPASPVHMWGYAAIPLLLALMFVYGQLMNMDRIADRYVNFRERYAEPTAFFDWFGNSVSNSSIYAINIPSLLLYGRDFSNRVYHATEGHSGYYGDIAYRWGEIEAFIETYQWTHIVVSFSYPEMQQAGLLPTPEVLAEIDQMRRHLEVVYEDEQIVLFATHYANRSEAF